MRSATESPGSSEPTRITGLAGDFVSVRLVYVVDFGTEIEAEASINDGLVTASIPPQEEDLVRFRLIGKSSEGVEGTWPIVGDGMRYGGTVAKASFGSHRFTDIKTVHAR